jgi:polysaccharide deacetylase family protein (PEP-CTERM system associated)
VSAQATAISRSTPAGDAPPAAVARAPRPTPTADGRMVNAFSVDVEDWFQVSDFEEQVRLDEWDRYESRVVGNTRRLLRLLREFRVKGTFFVLTWNAERHPGLVEEIAAEGHEVATHGYAHRLVYEQGRDLYRRDLERSIEILERIVGRRPRGYRAPSFSVTSRSMWALDVMLENGLEYDSSIFPVRDSLYGVPGAVRFPFVIHTAGARRLIEFPMTTAQVAGRNLPLGGGAYLRLLPYAYMRWGMRRVNREGQPAVVYLHPWEIDTEQPRLKSRGKRGVSTHYINLHAMEHKLRRLLTDFRFAPVGEVLAAHGLLAH